MPVVILVYLSMLTLFSSLSFISAALFENHLLFNKYCTLLSPLNMAVDRISYFWIRAIYSSTNCFSKACQAKFSFSKNQSADLVFLGIALSVAERMLLTPLLVDCSSHIPLCFQICDCTLKSILQTVHINS